jgi:hypothetical protein
MMPRRGRTTAAATISPGVAYLMNMTELNVTEVESDMFISRRK